MSHVTRFGTLGLLALLALSIQEKARAEDGPPIKTVFVIAMENHNWTQPTNQFSGPIQQIFQNPTPRSSIASLTEPPPATSADT
jgi:hypothetical protein